MVIGVAVANLFDNAFVPNPAIVVTSIILLPSPNATEAQVPAAVVLFVIKTYLFSPGAMVTIVTPVLPLTVNVFPPILLKSTLNPVLS